MTKNIIAWDLGATKCSAGIIEYDTKTQALTCKKTTTHKLNDAASLEELIYKIESSLGIAMSSADAVCIGAAGHFNGQSLIHLDGVYPYAMPFAKIANDQDWPHYSVIHDYASIICATFTGYMQQPDNIKRLNSCQMNMHGRRVAFGVGTGLGLKDGVLFPNGDFWFGKNEAGHIGISMPPSASREHLQQHEDFIHFLKQHHWIKRNHPITFEQVLSGQGIVRLYQFFYPGNDDITPEQVGEMMHSDSVPELKDAFAWYLGLFVGTVQLTFMPEGGVWITGGVAMTHMDVFDRPDFFAGIHASPAYLSQREEYPLGVLCNHEHALLGSAYYAVKRLL